MSWLAICDGRHTLRRPSLGPDAAQRLLAQGTLLIEFLVPPDGRGEHVVLDVDRSDGWRRRLRIAFGADGVLRVEHGQDRGLCHAKLPVTPFDREAALQLTFSWDAPVRLGRLSVQNLETGKIDSAVFSNPLPMPLDDAAACAVQGPHRALDATVALLAVSDRVETIGLSPGIAADTPIQTPDGLCMVEDLRPGDLVETGDTGPQPVRHVATQEWPALGRFAPVSLRAPFFGLQRDILLAPDHRVMIAGADAEYLFGTDSVLAEARFLALHAGGSVRRGSATLRYTQLVFDSHVCVNAAGAWCESLYVGDPATRRAMLTAAASVPTAETAQVPLHGQAAGPQLKPYETMVLVSALCA